MMETTVNNGMCRCCASEGAFKDVKSTYHWMGEEEIYADMLRDCFDISLKLTEHGNDGGICEVCITQLRNAINFKKQVLHTEEQFKKHLQNKLLFRPNIVKVEIPADDNSDDNNVSGGEGFSDNEFEVPIKTEVAEDPKPKKRAAKATTSRAKKAKSDNGETSTKREPQEDTVKVKAGRKEPNDVKHEGIKLVKLTLQQPKLIKTTATQLKTPVKIHKMDESENSTTVGLHRRNIREIMFWSNATPIRKYGDMGYMCCFCEDQYQKPADLKKHTLEVHKDVTQAYFLKKMSMYQYLIKLDITSLHCKICRKHFVSLEELMIHLKDDHKKIIYTDIKNHIIPFKFATESLKCFICNNVFHKFKLLLEHMHKHYRNYICEICDAGFINSSGLKYHLLTHRTGSFKCDYCPKEFNSLVKKRLHVRTRHTHKNSAHKCGYCTASFNDYRKKQVHLELVHGVKSQTPKCQACDKVYSSSKMLNVHIKRDHLLERPHGCAHCDMRFFSTSELKNHMLKHSGIRNYQCTVCLKFFGMKKTLKEHMRIHADDRRFKCKYCQQSFVQKCSWRAHMRSKHGEIV